MKFSELVGHGAFAGIIKSSACAALLFALTDADVCSEGVTQAPANRAFSRPVLL
jgi:hypothetical protein